MRIEAFLLGVIVTCSLTAGVFFLKFWRRTSDSLFLAFAVAFLIVGVNRISTLMVAARTKPVRGRILFACSRSC